MSKEIFYGTILHERWGHMGIMRTKENNIDSQKCDQKDRDLFPNSVTMDQNFVAIRYIYVLKVHY